MGPRNIIYQKNIDDSLLEVRKVCVDIEEILKNTIKDDQILNDIIVSIDEALTNIIYYSNPCKKNTAGNQDNSSQICQIHIEIIHQDNEIDICLRDNGIPFNINSVPIPDIQFNLTGKKRGGFGIFLIRKLMDAVESRRIAGANILRMKKQIPAS